ncbi:sugar O-acetyltransferase [Hymenobacter sp. BT491]|uniref:sugar O-acetyltransferase n=1 Tax=Hymenobacter sp. BT491 TaxID=2766779 RepID=UPI001653944F|nr:sugar O-acetyltransferase [Hymenobacter sp. BT491]MBC6988835.1 sugar O-acetyltransferase [Hymenobacter sp. BT491]
MSTLTEKQKMVAGELYYANDPELVEARRTAKALCFRYNQQPVDLDKDLLIKLLGYEANAHIEAPFRCDYGFNISLGQNFYANYNLIILDCAPVSIGDNVFIAPNVVLTTAGHPIDAATRISGLEFAHPITIGHNVWLGAGVIVLPGVEIGDNVTVGAGSVVTRSIPSNSVAVGNPCRVIKSL